MHEPSIPQALGLTIKDRFKVVLVLPGNGKQLIGDGGIPELVARCKENLLARQSMRLLSGVTCSGVDQMPLNPQQSPSHKRQRLQPAVPLSLGQGFLQHSDERLRSITPQV